MFQSQTTENFHLDLLENANDTDHLFIFRLDSISIGVLGEDNYQVISMEFVISWLKKYNIVQYIIAREYATETGKRHFHVCCILPSTMLHKYASDQFNKEIVKQFGLEKHQFSKKKNGEKHLTKNPEFKKILEKYNMEWYDYACCYYCKDYVGDGENYHWIVDDFDCIEFKRRYDIIQDELNKLPKNGRKNPAVNHMKSLIAGWNPEEMHTALFQSNVLIMDTDPTQSYEDKERYIRKLYTYIIDYFRDHNSKSRLAQILSQPRIQQYMYTILAYYHPVAIQDKDESIIKSFLPMKY